jgi:general secretion pathway protein F
MAGYRFEALDQAGKLRRGVLEVDSLRQGREQLRSKGLWPLELNPIVRNSGGLRLPRRRGLTSAQLSLLMRQFATLLGAKLTLEQTLNALVEQAESQNLREVLAGLRGEVLAGQSLAGAMQKFPRAFSGMVCTLVAAGEQSGRLGEVLARLADYAEQRQALRSKVGLALVYPLIVTAVAASVIVVLMTYVVPQIVGVFAHGKQALPWLTRALIAVSEFAQASLGWWLAGAALAGVLAWRALQRPALRLRFDAALLRAPLIGPLVRGVNAARFSSTAAILVNSGVPVLAALHAVAGVVGNLPMRQAVEQTERMVREGGGFSRSLARTGVFPPLLVHLAANGEASGELGAMLERAAASQAQDLEQRVAVLTSVFEPLLILVMGAVVLLIVLATLMPIIELNQFIR